MNRMQQNMNKNEKALDITPELAISAYNVLRQYCEGIRDCGECPFNFDDSGFDFCGNMEPCDWPEI